MEICENSCKICLIPCRDSYQLIEGSTIKKLSILNYDLAIGIPENSLICKKCLTLLDTFCDIRYRLNNPLANTNLHFSRPNVCQICLLDSISCTFDRIKMQQLFPDLGCNFNSYSLMCQDCFKILNELEEFRSYCLKANNMNNCEDIKVEEPTDFNIYKMLEFANSAGDHTAEIEKKPLCCRYETRTDYSDAYLSDHLLDDSLQASYEHYIEQNSNENKYKIFCIISQEFEVKPLKRNRVYLYICPSCKQSVGDIEKHIKEHTDFYGKLEYRCKHCDCRKQCLSEMQSHECLGPSKSSNIFYKCEQCHFKTRQKGNLKTHSLTHKNADEIPMFKCPQCKFKSRQKGNLKTHLLVHKKTDDIPMYKCYHCPFQARQKGNLQTHVLKKHKGSHESELIEALYRKCKKCPYKAKQNSTLKKHMALCHM